MLGCVKTNKGITMFDYLLSLLSASQLRRLKTLITLVLSRKLQYYDGEETYTHNYKGLRIEVKSELEGDYISSWEVYKGEELVKAEEDEFYYSVGEAERDAINYIDSLKNK